jgi:hypothetical protein
MKMGAYSMNVHGPVVSLMTQTSPITTRMDCFSMKANTIKPERHNTKIIKVTLFNKKI